MDKSKKIKYLSIAIKWLIVLFSFAFIYQQVIVKWRERQTESMQPLQNITDSFFLFVLVLLFVFFNWGFEALKWRFLVSKIQKVSFLQSYKGVLSGVTISIVAPFKTGEYIGRALHLNSEHRIEAGVLSVYGSMVQLFVTIFFGSISVVYCLPKLVFIGSSVQWLLYYLFIVLLLTLNFFLLLGLLHPSAFLVLINKSPLPKKWKSYFNVLSKFNATQLFKWAVVISALRYLVFSFQFYWCLAIFQVNLPVVEGLMMVAITFLGLSFLSVSALMELGVTRTAIALSLIQSYFSLNELTVSAGVWMASTFIWIINLALPALLGAIFLYSVKIFKDEK